MEQLNKSLQSYFSYLDKHNLKWQDCMQKAAKPLSALSNQAEQFRLVNKVEDEDDTKLPDIKNKLVSKIKSGVEEEITILKSILKECETNNKELRNKLVAVEKSCESADTALMLKGSATQPAPCLMVEWALDAWRLYHAFYAQINGSLKCLNCEDEGSVVNFQKAFKEDTVMKEHIQCILAYTKFFVEES